MVHSIEPMKREDWFEQNDALSAAQYLADNLPDPEVRGRFSVFNAYVEEHHEEDGWTPQFVGRTNNEVTAILMQRMGYEVYDNVTGEDYGS